MESIIFSNGSKMPIVGLGTWQAQDPLELKEAMEAAFENGYRHFDTAYLYGNENIIGKVIERWLSRNMVKREELFITTKLPLSGVHPDRVEMFLDKSLKNLGLEYVDLYLIHFPMCVKYDEKNPFPVNEAGELQIEETDHVKVWKKMEEMVHCGKARNIGLSNFSQAQISNILKNCQIKPANLQIELNLYYQNDELTDFCKKNGISIVAYSPLGSPGLNAFNKKRGFAVQDMPNMLADPEVVKMASKYKKTAAQILLKFQIQKGFAIIPKSVKSNRIKENIDIFDFEIDNDDMEKLKKLNRGNDAKICNMQMFKGVQNHPDFPFK